MFLWDEFSRSTQTLSSKSYENCLLDIFVETVHFDGFLKKISPLNSGPGSSVGIQTELRAGRSGVRIPVGRYFPPVQTGPEAHPVSCKMGTGSFPVVKYGRVVLLITQPLLVPRLWKSRAILLPILCATTGSVKGSLFLLFL